MGRDGTNDYTTDEDGAGRNRTWLTVLSDEFFYCVPGSSPGLNRTAPKHQRAFFFLAHSHKHRAAQAAKKKSVRLVRYFESWRSHLMRLVLSLCTFLLHQVLPFVLQIFRGSSVEFEIWIAENALPFALFVPVNHTINSLVSRAR